MKNKILTILFCGFICVMAAGTAFLPKREFSVNEKRELADFPEFSVKKLFSGRWENDFEDYISDRIPGREFFTGLDAYFTLYTGRNGAKGVCKGKDGRLFNTPVEYNAETLRENLGAINDFTEKTGLRASLIAVPSAGYIMPDKLPAVHGEYRDGEIISEIGELLGPDVELISIADELIKHKDDGIYYKTDRHWTSRGAYTAYAAFTELRGFEPLSDFDVKTEGGFYGTLYTKSALWGEKPDNIELWEYPIDVTVTINDGAEDKTYDTMFFENRLTEPDKYPVYLDGNHAFERIENHGSNGGKLLVIKDSYAHCLVPFLAAHYSRIDMVDLRYYFNSVSELAEAEQYDEVLFVYGLGSLCEDRDIAILE